MPKESSHVSTTFSEENIQLAKQELHDLNYKLKKIDAERKAYCVHTQQVLWKQSKVIEDLQIEKAEMCLNMRLIHSESVTKKDNVCRIELSNLLSMLDQCRQDIDDCKTRIRVVDGEIRLSNKKLHHQRRQMVAVHKSQDKAAREQKKVASLENRLNHGNVKYSELLTTNCELRQNIDSMLKLRARFNAAYIRIKKLMKAGKRKIMGTVQDATLAYHQRDETQSRIHILRERSRMDQVQLAEQIKDLHRMVEHDENMQTFLDRKGKDRIAGGSDKIADALSKETNGEQGDDRLTRCRVIFSKISSVSHADDVKTIILRFRQVEDKNFALFNYITELNNDAEKLQEVVQLRHEEIEVLQNKYKEKHKKEFQDYQSLESQVHEIKDEVVSLESAVDLHSKILEQVKEKISKLIQLTKLTGIDGDILGTKEGITDHNVIQHLGMLEGRILELVEMHRFLQFKLLEEEPQDEGSAVSAESALTAILPQTPPVVISAKDIAPPELGESIKYSEDINLSDVPISTAKLRAFAHSSLQKKHLSLVGTEPKGRKSHKQKKALEK